MKNLLTKLSLSLLLLSLTTPSSKALGDEVFPAIVPFGSAIQQFPGELARVEVTVLDRSTLEWGYSVPFTSRRHALSISGSIDVICNNPDGTPFYDWTVVNYSLPFTSSTPDTLDISFSEWSLQGTDVYVGDAVDRFEGRSEIPLTWSLYHQNTYTLTDGALAGPPSAYVDPLDCALLVLYYPAETPAP